MQGLIRLVCLIYVIGFTVLLLAANPLKLVGAGHHAPWIVQSLLPVAHFLGFGMLTLLALAARWPVPRWCIMGLLVLYAGSTEILQAMLPPRKAEWGDWLQDVLGVAAGIAICWPAASILGVLQRKRQKRRNSRGSRISNEWDLVQSVMSRSTVRGESWWA